MTEQRQGKVVTFYSFKGGTGRTMALANVAWILAANGRKVLVADWDLESPGLHRFFGPFLKRDVIETTGGVIDMISKYEWQTTRTVERGPDWHTKFARVNQYAFSLDWDDFPKGGSIDFLSAGRQNKDYADVLNGMNWDDFYGRLGGGTFLDALRADVRANYDYTLIDSRTGLSDVAAICTVHLPDVLVDCFTLSAQGIDGAARVAEAVARHPHIRILPVAMRVDPAEKDKVDAGRTFAMRRFAGMPADMAANERADYWNAVEVPYRPFYAYEETLATFGDRPGQTTSLLAAYEMLAKHITKGDVVTMPAMEEGLRVRTVSRFVRRVSEVEDEVNLRYAPEDQLWAEWVTGLLVAAGVRVNDPVTTAEDRPSGSARSLTLISQANAADQIGKVPGDRSDPRPPLAIYLEDLPGQGMTATASAFLAGTSFDTAVERVLRLVGRSNSDNVDLSAIGVRFPGTRSAVFNPPARNARFTGREDDLLELRAQLRGGRTVVLSGTPVALHGMGGIGKTQVALEYAYRFRNAYDIVWWIVADQVMFLDTRLFELGEELKLNLPVSNVPDAARVVLNALERGEPSPRWLLIMDNAEDVKGVLEYVPRGPGHVLITSRNSQWGEAARSMQIDVFKRQESISHLRQRLPAIRLEEADRIADLLGDLPIAVAAAGAWLAETGEPIGEYLRHVEQKGPGDAVEEVWGLSLKLLRERSAAAYRLLQLCSLMASDIPLDLVRGDEVASVLAQLDSSVSERSYRGVLVQHINRLALLKLDNNRGQIQVHRLLQHVVRSRMSTEELAETRHEIHLILAASRPRYEVDDHRSWPRFQMLWPHLEVSNAAECDIESARQLMIDRVRYIWVTGGLAEGVILGQQIERRWSETLATAEAAGQDATTLRRQLLHLRFNIANLMRQVGQFEDARALDEQNLADQTALLGAAHPHTLMSAGGLGGDLRALGRYKEALSRDEQTYRAWVELFGEDYEGTLAALSNLATTQRLAGDFRNARDRDQELYDKRRLIVGESNRYTLGTGTNLGRDLREAGQYRLSVELLEKIAKQHEEVFGALSHRTLSAKANLAVSLGSAGRVDEAARMLDDAYGQLNEVAGPNNPDTLAARLSRAVSLLSIGQVASCESELEEVRAAYAASLGQRHPHTLVCVSNLAATARAAGEPGRAVLQAGTVVSDMIDVLGENHPYTLAAELNLAILLADTGEPGKGLDLLESTLGRHRVVLGPDHPDTLRCSANRLLMRKAADKDILTEDADAADQLAKALGADHPAVSALRQGRYLHRLLDPHPY